MMTGDERAGLARARRDLLALLAAALSAVDGRRCVRAALAADDDSAPVHVVAIGKAAPAMMQGALDALGGRVARALVVTKTGSKALLPAPVRVLEAGHPWPTAVSLAAGSELLAFLKATPAAGRLLFLISGGASSLVEVLPADITLADLHRANDWLLGSGLDIHAINHVRKALSCIKGGRLVGHLGGRPARALLISDVPGDDPASIGSGLLVADTPVETDAPLSLPDWLTALMRHSQPAPAPSDPVFETIELEIVATLDDAMQAAAVQGRDLGYDVYLHAGVLGGESMLVGRQLAAELLDRAPALHVWGGETTVRLPAKPGRGGRNQTVALAAAMVLAGHEEVALLAAGTDGSDGPTLDAGGLVDGGTVARGELAGLQAQVCLDQADAGTFLEAAGDLVQTGPTGTNVMDLILGVRLSQADVGSGRADDD